MSKRLIITYLLSLLDLICTLALVSLYGIGIEANPIGIAILQSPWGIAYKGIGVGLLLGVLWQCREMRAARAGAWVCMCAYSVLALYHLVILAAIAV